MWGYGPDYGMMGWGRWGYDGPLNMIIWLLILGIVIAGIVWLVRVVARTSQTIPAMTIPRIRSQMIIFSGPSHPHLPQPIIP